MSTLEKIFSILSTKFGFTNILFCLFVGLLLYLWKKYFHQKQLFQQEFPSFKIRELNLFGHASLLPRGPAFDKLYAHNVYVLQTLESLRILNSKDGVFTIWVLNIPFLILHKAESIKAFLSSTQDLDKALSYNVFHPWLGTGLLTSNGTKWKSRRKILTPSFHFDILKDFLPIINEKAIILHDILKDSTSEEWIDLVQVMTLCSLDIICETTLGVNINAQKHSDSEYIKAIFRISELTMERIISPSQWISFFFFRSKTGQMYLKEIDIVHSFTRNIIREKKNALKLNADLKEPAVKPKRQALMDLLLNYHMVYQDFTEEDVREEVDTFAFEGHDTTSMALSWSLFMIGLYPHIQKKVHEELDVIFGNDDRHVTTEDLKHMRYLECVIKEALRLFPSVPVIGRQLSEGCELGERRCPKYVECGAFIYGLHRDPDVFPNPEYFDPERFFPENASGRDPYAYVPFAAGPRNCIGQRFAMMEIKVVLATVLRSFRMQSLDTRDKILPKLDVILRPSSVVRMKVTSRNE